MAKSEGKHYRFRNFEFWAERGMITLVDLNDASDNKPVDEYRQRLSPGEFMKRAIAALVSEPDKYPSVLRELRNLVQNAAEAAKLAKAQGDPTDQKVIDHMLKHKSKSSALILPGTPSELPAMPSAPVKFASKSADSVLKSGFDIVPDFSIGVDTLPAAAKVNNVRQRGQ